jgi:hypothetical protein
MAGLGGHPMVQSTGGGQYTVSSPLMSQPTTSSQSGAGGQLGSSPGGLPGSLDNSAPGSSLASHPGMMAASPYPAGYSLANIPGVDWSSLGYSLPAMYTL